jgi:preprotein translocase subunit SecA
VREINEIHATGRPILIGTRSIDKSDAVAAMLRAAGIEHNVLNAHQVAREAELVAEAGERGKVTVSTNMAGRGTDIKLGEGVSALGGLHVICTEMHDAARIDRQLIGRCGRQGDPGTFRQFLALDDDILLAGLGPDKSEKLKDRGARGGRSFDDHSRLFQKAQRSIERQKFRQRRVLLYQEKEHHKAQRQMGQDPYLDAPG